MARLTLRLDEDTIREIAAFAAEQGMSQSAWLAQKIHGFVAASADPTTASARRLAFRLSNAEGPSAEDHQ
jgi:hypothetical protein